jgi:hypothetical protein
MNLSQHSTLPQGVSAGEGSQERGASVNGATELEFVAGSGDDCVGIDLADHDHGVVAEIAGVIPAARA